MIEVEVLKARGHPAVKALHRSTFEVTREESLTPRGDCIVGVGADKALTDLSERFRRLLARGSRLVVVLECEGLVDVVRAWGDPRLTLASHTSIVIRRSSYIDDRTLAVRSDKAAADLDRGLVARLRRGAPLLVHLVAYTLDQEAEATEFLDSMLEELRTRCSSNSMHRIPKLR